jgi:tRNA uridine 5-carbamoylmethylation protein Kti12
MRNNKKNWEIFSKGGKENATIYDHFPTTPALITTTFNNGGNMMVETMNEGKDKYILSSQLDKNLEQQKIICNFKNFNNSMRKQLINLQKEYSKLLNTYLKVAQ